MPYVYANVKVKYGQLPASYEAMVTIRRVMEENGWKLLGAWSTVIGDIHDVHDMWEVEDANKHGADRLCRGRRGSRVRAGVRPAGDDRRPRGPLARREDPYSP